MHQKFKNAVLLSTAIFTGNASADAITLTAASIFSIDGDPFQTLSQVRSTSNTPTTPYPPQSVSIYRFVDSSTGSSYGIHTFGNSSGVFGSRSSGSGVYDVRSNYQFNLQINNETTSAQHYFYSFTIDGGYLAANANTLTGNQFANAEFSIDLQLNDRSMFQSAAQVRMSASENEITSSGTAIFDNSDIYCPDNTYCSVYWYDQTINLDLGVLDAGASMDFTYDLFTRAWGDNAGRQQRIRVYTYDPEPIYDANNNVIGYQCDIANGEVSGTYVPESGLCEDAALDYWADSSIARFGDPDSLSGSPIGPFGLLTSQAVDNSTGSTSVPEPAPIALLGMGLAGLLVARRRKAIR